VFGEEATDFEAAPPHASGPTNARSWMQLRSRSVGHTFSGRSAPARVEDADGFGW
jgi:hypothetical protein